MGKIVKITQGGKKEIDSYRKIDLSRVEKIAREYEECLLKRDNIKDRKHISYSVKILEEAKEFDKNQLEFLTTYLTGIANKLSDLYQRALDNPDKFAEEVKELRKLYDLIDDKEKYDH